MSQTMLYLLLEATFLTFSMVVVSGTITFLIGLPLGALLYSTQNKKILAQPKLNFILSAFIDITRSIPFVILMVALTPLTRLITGTSIGTIAAMVPLTICAIPFYARISENALCEVDSGLIDVAHALGANNWQIIYKILIPEALPNMLNGLTLTLVNLIGYSAMAGAIGGGGLGDVAIRYGYQRFDTNVLFITVIIMVILVQGIQITGDVLVKRISHHKK